MELYAYDERIRCFIMTLPVSKYLPEILEAISSAPLTIIEAAPGTGKSTLIPLELLKHTTGKILLLEPRRVAAKSLALFLAKQLGESVGQTVGYRMRADSKVSSGTKLEVITEGLLSRMLIDNPELPDVTHILFDEFHERSLQTDESLALSLNAQKLFRADLKLIIMSATLDPGKLKKIFPDAPWVSVPGISFPVETHYLDKPDRLEEGIFRGISRALKSAHGDILVFLPGRGEIERVKTKLLSEKIDSEVIILTSETDSRDVFSLFQESAAPRIILSTSVAETSITLPYVVAVVDSGLSRFSIYNPNTGLSELVTRKSSMAVVDQRRGRAGRVRAGNCYRLWKEGETLLSSLEPEILREDITSFALGALAFGINTLRDLVLLDPPQEDSWQKALELLMGLGAIDKHHVVLPHGEKLLKLGMHPRLAHLLFEGKARGYTESAAYACAVLESSFPYGKTLEEAISKLKAGNTLQKRQAERYNRLVGGEQDTAAPEFWYLLFSAYPERLGRKTERGTYILSSGGEFKLEGEQSEFICAAKVQRHKMVGKIDLYEPVSITQLKKFLKVEKVNSVEFDGEKIRGTSKERIGGIVLNQGHYSPTAEEKIVAIRRWLEDEGLEKLIENSNARDLITRVKWGTIHGVESGLSLEELKSSLDDWFFPFTELVSDFSKLDLRSALLTKLSFHERKVLEENIPEFLALETGTKAKIDYRLDGSAYVAIVLQELFGLSASPVICGVPLTIELLSPRRLPIQVTGDLQSFWKTVYPELKGQLKRDYPRHYWPDDPVNSKPVLKGLLRNFRN